ncbi:MAG TPA: type II secretion system minor pseudopilin GspK [Pseudoxanthomonas sp.]|nr:type II secretion system minor pseudopilin GspK [Pseudoxanthomonas sp.]
MKRAQRGVALLTVLLLVAVMTVLLMAVLDDIRFGLRRAANAQNVAQAQWYALGTEALAQARIQRLALRDGGRTTLAGDWNGRPIVFPLGEGDRRDGMISARLRDGTACFNLNSVVQGAGEQWQRYGIGVGQYLALMQALEFSPRQAETLADALVDWIDSDQQAGTGGGEDGHYLARPEASRTAGALLAEVSELAAIHGYDAASIARLRPHVCALPNAALSPVNLNTLQPDDAVILRMLTGNALGLAEARRVLAARPAAGWHDVLAFWSQPALARAAMPDPVLQQVALRSRYFNLHAEVEYAGAQVVLSALFEQDASGRTRLVARRWSNEE